MIPGRTLHRIAAALLPHETRDRIIDAQLGDFQHEWLSAKSLKARLAVLLHGYAAFWMMLPICVVRGLHRTTLDGILKVITVVIVIPVTALLIAGSGSWVRTGSISWSDAWRAALDARMISIGPWIALTQHYTRTRRLSAIAVSLALLASLAIRGLAVDSRESLAHWLTGLVFYMGLALILPRLFRERSS